MKLLPYALLLLLLMSFQSYALDCPKIPEQTNKELDVEVKAAVGKIGPVKGAELETRTKKVILDLMGKLPQADKVYLEQMMYATYCSALRDDKTLPESEKAARIRTYNIEVRRTLFPPEATKDRKQQGAFPGNERMEARLRLAQMSLAFTSDTFFGSVKKGDTDAVKLFLAAGMDPNVKDKDGDTGLTHAVRKGHRPIIDVLLKAKANVNEKNNWGWTAVSDAVSPDKKDILLVLLKHSANVEALNGAFLAAASYGDRDTLNMLIKRGADVRAVWDGRSIRDLALRNAVQDSSGPEKDVNETVKYVLDLGADVNSDFEQQRGKTTVLLLAVEKGSGSIVRTLLDRGADPRTRWECKCVLAGFTPLMLAAWQAGNTGYPTSIVTSLLDSGAEINARCESDNAYDYGGSTALMVAVIKGNSKVAEILITRNADLTVRNDKGETALLLAAKQHMDGNIFASLMHKGVDINQSDNKGATALMNAAWICEVDYVHALLGMSADVDIKNNAGETALLVAVSAHSCDKKRELIRLLVDKGANINAKTNDGKTALMTAVSGGDISTVETLLEKGADANAKDLYGKRALDFAEKGGLTDDIRDKMLWVLKAAADARK